MKAERQDAARRRFKERADELTLSIAKNEETKDSYSEKLTQHRWVESIMNRQGRWVESIMNIGRAGGWSQ